MLNCPFFPWPLTATVSFFLSSGAVRDARIRRAARAFGEYLSQNHPEGRNGSGKSTDTPCLCPRVHVPIS